MRVDVATSHREYDGFFKLDKAILRYERSDGRMSEPVERLVFERGDSVAVLLYEPERRMVVLVEQFRYPAYLREGCSARLLEVVAGSVDGGRSADAVARDEVAEEAGYSLERMRHITTFYPSPGACSERIHLYLGYVSGRERVGPGGGKAEEGEDTHVVEMPLKEALRRVKEGAIRDAKTIIALQYLALWGEND